MADRRAADIAASCCGDPSRGSRLRIDAFDRDIGWATTLVAVVGTAFSIFFVINAGGLLAAADHASKVFLR